MAWTTWPPTAPGGPSAQQGGFDGNNAWPTKWSATRSMLGLVQMRLMDVTIIEANTLESPGRFLEPARIRTRLLNSAGTALTSWVYVPKYWGITGAWTNLGTISTRQPVRLETAAAVQTSTGGPVNWVSWRAELRCDNYGGTA